MSYEPEAGPGRHRKPRPPIPPWEPRDLTCVCGEHPDVENGGPVIPPCLPPIPPPAPLPPAPVLPEPRYQHRRPRVDDPVPEGVISLHEARLRRQFREDMARYRHGS
ncbi:hypothetical protein ACGF0D_42905 [Kitasatospora sp. NPDC048298]|uniref:hypothetical protein n=1 Tax=Kitasatospora sp. NPDC048298 TaxID=3364049 RepID=UPI00371EE735